MNVRAEDVAKRFGRITAIEGVSLDILAGAVTCVLGDNGAGKSTLIRILSGVFPPSEGTLRFDGVPGVLSSPRDARERGIATVHQDLGVIPLLSVWRNFFLGAEPTKGWGPLRRIDVSRAVRVTGEELARLGIHLRDPHLPAGVLSGGERQSLAIARALHFGARVLILDEPTAALGVKQAELVLEQVVRARERGVAVVFVTHNPRHALQVGDRFAVLRRGSLVADRPRERVSLDELSELMSGRGPDPA